MKYALMYPSTLAKITLELSAKIYLHITTCIESSNLLLRGKNFCRQFFSLLKVAAAY